LPSDTTTSTSVTYTDDEVRASLIKELRSDTHLDAKTISVNVSSGVAELTGSVTLFRWKERADRVARVVRGVRAVVNRIRVVVVHRADPDITTDVVAALHGTAALAGMPIRITVSDGVVELDGSITSWDEQQLAERVAGGVPGVRFCQNQLVASDIARTDAVLAADIRSLFDWEPLIAHDPIHVAVSSARVSLSGIVGSRAEALRAARLARVKGVVSVDGRNLDVTSQRPDADVRDRWPSDREMSMVVPDLARYWPSVSTSSLSIAILDGTATLRGNVRSLAESRAAAEMVRSIVGVVKVDNQIGGPWRHDAAPVPVSPRRRRR
jgi:osmotically-inducible protein OsmY